MKRDMDLIRHLLLEIEQKDDGSGQWVSIDEKSWLHAQVVDHLFQLSEQDLIEGNNTSTMSGRDFRARRLTAMGHDYIDSIRDPKIWKKTKEGAEAAGGFTLDLIGELAKGFVKTEIKKRTGVDL